MVYCTKIKKERKTLRVTTNFTAYGLGAFCKPYAVRASVSFGRGNIPHSLLLAFHLTRHPSIHLSTRWLILSPIYPHCLFR